MDYERDGVLRKLPYEKCLKMSVNKGGKAQISRRKGALMMKWKQRNKMMTIGKESETPKAQKENEKERTKKTEKSRK